MTRSELKYESRETFKSRGQVHQQVQPVQCESGVISYYKLSAAGVSVGIVVVVVILVINVSTLSFFLKNVSMM